jgi:hypothetical protein
LRKLPKVFIYHYGPSYARIRWLGNYNLNQKFRETAINKESSFNIWTLSLSITRNLRLMLLIWNGPNNFKTIRIKRVKINLQAI